MQSVRQVQPYAIALFLVTIATCGALLIDRLGNSNFFFVFLMAISLSASYGGMRAGLFATGLSMASLAYFLLPPRFSFLIPYEFVSLIVLFGGVSILLTILIGQRQSAEERFRATFEQAAVGIAHVALDGRWLSFNHRLTQMLGYTHEELQRLTFQDITHPDDLQVDLNYARQLRDGEIETYSLEKRYLCKGGSTIWINLTASIVRYPSGKPHYYISVIEDIQARKQAEAKVQKFNAELEQRVAERTIQLTEVVEQLEAFTYTVSHDLRAPLRAIQGYSTIFIEDYADCLDTTGVQYAQSLMDAGIRMDELIQDLLSYSRLTRSEIRLQSISLNTVIEDVCKVLESQVKTKGAKIDVQSPLPSVLAHRPTLEQVITNLVTNGLKFVSPGTSPSINIRATLNGKWVRLWIEDNGIGVASEYQGRIFRIFERLHGIETYPGTGIGLSIVQKGIERMGGRVGVESVVGQGSRFWIELQKGDEHRE